MYVLIINHGGSMRLLEINSVCAFLIKESLNRFVHIKYVGFIKGYILIELLSSISNTGWNM